MLSCLLLASCAKTPPVTTPSTAPASTASPAHQIIPLPRSVAASGGEGFTLAADTSIVVPPGDERLRRIGAFLSDTIGLALSERPMRVDVTAGASTPAGAIALELGGATLAGDEAYDLTVTTRGVTIRAPTATGLFYGVQSFRQLLPAFIEYRALRPDPSRPVVAPAVRIADAPRFSWRGAMLDVARHFLSVDDVKRYVDLMAVYKLNRLHLHLSDDQGWRLEIASWPRLAARGGSTEVGGGPGGYYTQAQYADLVRYAADRFVTIVPEIDLPGHTNAALASYAELNCDGAARDLYTGVEVGFSVVCVDSAVTYRFIDDVVREIAALTPGPWFHIGGDEVRTLSADRYVTFVERVQAIVASHGKQVIGWDEIASAPLLPTSIVHLWRPKTTPAEAVARGARVIMSPADRTYLDMKYDATTPIGLSWAGLIDVKMAYDWDPAAVAQGVPESAILGVEAPLWTETVATIRDVEFLAFPRLVTIADVAWARQDARDWNAFRQRLGAHGPRLTALGVNFYRSPAVPWTP